MTAPAGGGSVVTMASDDILQLRIDDGVALVAINRPAQRNAMSVSLVQRMLVAFARLEADPAIRVILLHGTGRGFCAGSDLGELAGMTDADRSLFEAESGRLARTIAHLRMPVVAAIHGFAIGGGLTLAAGCDIVVSEPAVRWSLPEVPIGLFPAWGLGLVTDRIGRSAARRLSWGIDTLDGTEAARLGLADQLADDALGAARATALRLAALPAAQSESVKRYFSAAPAGEAADLAANRLFMQAVATSEAAESFRRFGRKPA